MEPGMALALLKAAATLHKAAKVITLQEDKDKLSYIADLIIDIVAQNAQYT